MLLNNDQHKGKGTKGISDPMLGIVSHSKVVSYKDEFGNTHEHRIPQHKRESEKCPVDQNLSASDFSLSTMVQLGNKLETFKAPVIDRFAQVDLTIANLHILNSPEFHLKETSATAVDQGSHAEVETFDPPQTVNTPE